MLCMHMLISLLFVYLPLRTMDIIELKRYFRAASEAAQEVLNEHEDGTPDKSDLLRLINEAEDHQQPLTSPSKMVALQLARGNSYFK